MNANDNHNLDVPSDYVWDGEGFISPEDFHTRFELVDGEWREK